MEWEGGLPPPSPIPTPMRAKPICTKLVASPVNAVKPLQVAKAIERIFTRLKRSANQAIGIRH